MHYNPAVFFSRLFMLFFFYSIETVLEEKVVFFCFRLPFKTEGTRNVTGCL